jgi:hypothetical protein
MNRRRFLKSIGKVVAGLVVAPSVVKGSPKRLIIKKTRAMGITTFDIANEALEKIGEKPIISPSAQMADGLLGLCPELLGLCPDPRGFMLSELRRAKFPKEYIAT